MQTQRIYLMMSIYLMPVTRMVVVVVAEGVVIVVGGSSGGVVPRRVEGVPTTGIGDSTARSGSDADVESGVEHRSCGSLVMMVAVAVAVGMVVMML